MKSDFLKNARTLANKICLDIDKHSIELAIEIRAVEETFLDLFSRGKLNGTVHTCSGQEFSAISVIKNLTDYV